MWFLCLFFLNLYVGSWILTCEDSQILLTPDKRKTKEKKNNIKDSAKLCADVTGRKKPLQSKLWVGSSLKVGALVTGSLRLMLLFYFPLVFTDKFTFTYNCTYKTSVLKVTKAKLGGDGCLVNSEQGRIN